MQGFREFMQNYEDIKKLVFDVLDPQRNTIDPDSKSILSRQLSEFKLRDKLLTAPSLADIINRSDNRGAIEAAVKNSTTTIGNLLALLSQEAEYKEPKYLG